MKAASLIPRLTDIIEAIAHIRTELDDVPLDAFEADWRLPAVLKARHPEIPWRKVAGIGNVLRHEYERIAPDVLWRLTGDDLPPLEQVCRVELAAAKD